MSGSSDYDDRNGNYSSFPFENVSEWRSDHTENGGIKRGEVQIVNIDFHQSREKVALGGISQILL